MSKGLGFLEKFMGPMAKIAQFKLVRAVMAAGVASIPFTIVGSMFLVLNILPDTIPALQGIFDSSVFRLQDLYMVANKATMGILALYFSIVIGYELTKIYADEEDIDINPVSGALLSLFAFFMCIPELVFVDGRFSLIQSVTEDEHVINGWRMVGDGVSRIGTSGIFTAIIMGVISVLVYRFCVKRNWTIKMPDAVPEGVSRAFTALIPTFVVAFVVLIINGVLVALGTDIFNIIAIPFGFVTKLTDTWIGIVIIYFLIHALWLVGIHGANIVDALVKPMLLSNMAANAAGANIPFAGEFQNTYVVLGGSGATLGMTIFIAFLARSEQLKVLGRASLGPAIFNINEPIIFGLPIVYNPFMAVPFFLAPITTASLGYWATKLKIVKPIIAQMPWPSPAGTGAFIGTGGDFKAVILAFICVIVAFIIYLPFIKYYDNKLYREEQGNSTDV
ncbi:MAG: PTS cellobiose transporter subunit IIC [Miniphocaeibacter sp.]|uniref:PTS cellobiose transporter subunit IIC n=1 Tax=Miniphocaeibacter halophilus TaxID=2931922 RepID=A0AC61MU67_9FIRM|nr:PTS cellobiose transporter subunit IIC [Miniphocaeibacter halophilus]QQK08160.1 PTS cellobiose transporter subunit IIC [Miniphocaeibacter halophilus]